MKPDEIIKRLCKLASMVGETKCEAVLSHDCFCGDQPVGFDYSFSPKILQYIEDAVKSKLIEDKIIANCDKFQ